MSDRIRDMLLDAGLSLVEAEAHAAAVASGAPLDLGLLDPAKAQTRRLRDDRRDDDHEAVTNGERSL